VTDFASRPGEGTEREKRDKRLRRGTRVQTEDGPGEIIGMNMRRNTNGGPGVRQYVVKLDDGRVRHYTTEGMATL
jgi:hypothetical protein